MGAGIEAYIAGISMQMSQVNVANQVQTSMLKKMLDADTAAMSQLMEGVAAAPVYGDVGGLMNTKA